MNTSSGDQTGLPDGCTRASHGHHHLSDARAPVCRLEELVVGYGGRGILPPVTVTIGRGEFWVVLGRNGCGKSTLLRTLLGLQPAVGGRVAVSRGVRIGYVPQRIPQLQGMPARVKDVVRDGAEVSWTFLRPWRRGQHGCVTDALVAAGCSHLADEQFDELSEGQKQRVLVARALASHPAILVLDEPSSAMDHVAERELHDTLRQLTVERGISVVLVNHHIELTVQYADHALFLDRDTQVVLSGCLQDVIQSHPFRHRYTPMHDDPPCPDC